MIILPKVHEFEQLLSNPIDKIYFIEWVRISDYGNNLQFQCFPHLPINFSLKEDKNLIKEMFSNIRKRQDFIISYCKLPQPSLFIFSQKAYIDFLECCTLI